MLKGLLPTTPMPALNTTLLAVSFALQVLLLLALLRRGILRRLPTFAALLAFYLLRSILLLVLFHRMTGMHYADIYSAFSTLDLLLQVAVAWELLSRSLYAGPPHPFGFSLSQRLALALGLAAASAGLTWALARLIPHNPRFPLDRGVVFASALLLSVALVCLPLQRTLPRVRRVLAGLAALSVAGLASQIGRALAAYHRHAAAFTHWSYVEPAVYLLVLALWLATLRDPSSTPTTLAPVA